MVWNEKAGGEWPAAVEQLAAGCEGRVFGPSKEAWDEGARSVVCLETYLAGGS